MPFEKKSTKPVDVGEEVTDEEAATLPPAEVEVTETPAVFSKFRGKAHSLALEAYQKAHKRGATEADSITDGVIAAKEFARTGQKAVEED